MNGRPLLAVCLVVGLYGCASVDMTKTAKGFYPPTRPDDVEVLMTRPDRHFVELGTVSTTKWDVQDTAKMHNALRAKAAPLGAEAVIITASGIVPGPMGSQQMWTTGVAVRFSESQKSSGEAKQPGQ